MTELEALSALRGDDSCRRARRGGAVGDVAPIGRSAARLASARGIEAIERQDLPRRRRSSRG